MDRPFGMLRSVTHGVDAPRSIKKGTIPRIWRFAAPYRRGLLAFLLFTVVSSVVGVITPILAGRVVDTIVARGDAAVAAATVLGLAGGIAALAVVEAVSGSATRWLSSRIGEGLILDLRRAVFDHVQRDAGRVLHPHPDRRAGQPAQQRRDRGAAGVHRHAVRRGQQRRHAGARRSP